MIYVRGLGCLSPMLFIIMFVASLSGASILTRGDGIPVALLVVAGLMALLAPLHWLLGWVLNSEWTPSGRLWHNRHTVGDRPMQDVYAAQLVFALVLASLGLGSLTSPLYGWLLFGGVLAVAVVGKYRRRVARGRYARPPKRWATRKRE